MRPCCLLAVVLLLTAPADAALLYMRWMDAPTNQWLALSPGETTDIGIFVDLLADESVSSLTYDFRSLPSGDFSLASATPEHPSFWVTSVPGLLNDAHVALIPADVTPAPQAPAGPGTFLLATATIALTGYSGTPVGEVSFKRWPLPEMSDGSGSDFTYDPRYASTYPGYMAFGDYGNPGWCVKCGPDSVEAPNPLLVSIYAEPSTLAALGILAAALLSRRPIR